MHVLIIFILILGLVLARISSPRLNEGFESGLFGATGSTGSIEPTVLSESTEPTVLSEPEPTLIGQTGGSEQPVPFIQAPLYSGIW